MPKCSAAKREARPQRDRVRGIRRNRRYSGKEQRGKRNETPPARHRIQRAAQDGSKEEQDSARQAEIGRVQSLRNVPDRRSRADLTSSASRTTRGLRSGPIREWTRVRGIPKQVSTVEERRFSAA